MALNLVGPVIELGKCICPLLTRQIDYLRKLHDNMESLKREMETLNAMETDIKTALNRATEAQQQKPAEVAKIWLKNVEKVQTKVNSIERRIEENKRCFPNCHSRLKLGKNVCKVTQEVIRLQETSPGSDSLVVNLSPKRAEFLPVQSLVGKSTAEKTLDLIWDCLVDVKIGKIGVCGMGGVGKTTIMLHINNRLTKTNHFDKVIWVTVSRDLSLERLQNEIAWALDLKLPTGGGMMNRAAKLLERLKKAKRCLIILDDMWEIVSLKDVGIPEPNKENCKIVLTTRLLNVCRGMETEKVIQVEVLTDGEAWDLFRTKAGDNVLSPKINPLAKLVANECGGLPLAIITIGHAMRDADEIKVWRNALNELRNSPMEIQGMEDQVFKLLRFSYNHLKSDRIRNCFLYFSFFPEDYKLRPEELIEYWMAEGWIIGRDREAEIDKGFTILKELKDASMLQILENEYIGMHDLLRDLAIHITREECGFLIKSGLGIDRLPKEEEWNEASKISLVRNHINSLPIQPNCPKLSTLLLRNNPLSLNIHVLFFNQMHALRFLDLSDSSITVLPTSLSNLTNLQTLFLQNCMALETLPSVAKLNELRVLNLSHTNITILPPEMEGLVKLRSLDLSNTSRLEKIEVGVIPKLSLLEDLWMKGSGCFRSDSIDVATCIMEMRDLKHLTFLTLSIGGFVSFFNAVKCQQWEVLKGCSIEIGEQTEEYFQQTTRGGSTKALEPTHIVSILNRDIISEAGTLLLPSSIQELIIDNCVITRFSGLVYLANLGVLKKCTFKHCNLMDCFMIGDEVEENALANLEELSFYQMLCLTALWKGILPYGSLTYLRILEVSYCHSLKNLFHYKNLEHLKNIECIKVENCRVMEEIVSTDTEDFRDDNTIITTTTTIALPKLHTLILSQLLELHSISRNMLVCDSLRHVEVELCPMLRKLPFSVDCLSNLQAISSEREWWDALEWDDAGTKALLQPRFSQLEFPSESYYY